MKSARRRLLQTLPAVAAGVTLPARVTRAATPDPLAGSAGAVASTPAAAPPGSTAPVSSIPAAPGPAASAAPWPAEEAVAPLRAKVGAALIAPRSPFAVCADDAQACAQRFAALRNPYAIRDEPALTQSFGWTDAWTTAASPWAVAARDTADVVAAVEFARTHGVRLVIKGGGHGYLGTSNDGDALLIWTRHLDHIELHEHFVPWGCPPDHGSRAVSLGAGAIWSQAYDVVTTHGGGYVQGGGCMTVGVAGLVLSGGFGSFSKAYGLASASLLEAEIVTADGQVRIANACSEPDLFWALKGGGGGSFGVLTRLTLRMHALPTSIGAVNFTVHTGDDDAYRRLIDEVLALCARDLINPHWGEQIRFLRGNVLDVAMVFQGLDRAAAQAVWAPLFEWLDAHPRDHRIDFNPFRIVTTDVRGFWAPTLLKRLLGFIGQDDRPGADPRNVFWSGDQRQAGQVLQGYESQWLPAGLLAASRRPALAEALFLASREHGISLHLNKGLAGAPQPARDQALQTAVNPAVVEAFALAICGAEGPPALPGVAGHEPDVALARRRRQAIDRAMAPVRAVAGGAASYLSESNFFLEGWADAYWGPNRERLAKVKARYDPDDLFRVHHGIEGSAGAPRT